jgi:prepilin-type processing-associated H-X9-DG protein
LALNNYNDVFATFPPGWIARDVKPPTGPCFGWGTSLLPFLEQAPLYNRINFNAPPAVTNAIFQTPIAYYRCPEDTSEDTNPVRDEFGTSNYAGNYGDRPLPGSVNAATKANGVFFWNSSVRQRDITDGTSAVFAIGERCIASAAGIWVGVRSNQNAGDDVAACNHEARPNTVIDSFSSRHAGGVYFLFCDGAVHFINDDIGSQEGNDPPKGTYQRLAHKSDGAAVDGY